MTFLKTCSYKYFRLRFEFFTVFSIGHVNFGLRLRTTKNYSDASRTKFQRIKVFAKQEWTITEKYLTIREN